MLFAALAGNNTYCVGGYNACRAEARKHPQWHHHSNVLAPNGVCYACFDEQDDSCDDNFLSRNRRWRKTTRRSCPNTQLPIRHNVKAGRETRPPPPPVPVTPEPPPPPPPVAFTPVITRVSAGPYAAGDTVTVYAEVRGPKGRKGAKSGTVLVTAGGKTARFQARAAADGSVKVKITLPPGASAVTIRFEPAMYKLAANESLSARQSAPRTLKVNSCPYRVSVAQPTKGSSVKVGAPLLLVPKLRSTGQSGTPSKLALTWTIVPPNKSPVKLSSDARGQATWNVPADLSNQTVSISVGGRADGALACSAGERILPISKLGLGWNTRKLPSSCTVDKPCTGTATLVLPTEPKARAAVEALLNKPGTKVALIAGGTRTEVPVNKNHQYSFSTVSSTPGTSWFRLEVLGPGGGDLKVDPHAVQVNPGLKLVLPNELDFGTFAVGTNWTDVCQPLDYSASTSWEDHAWKLEVIGADDCVATPVLMYANAWGQPSQASLLSAVETDPHHEMRPIHDICLSTRGCSSETSPEVFLVVTPVDPAFAAEAKRVRLKWVVEGQNWMWCWGWMLLPFVVAAILAAIVYGWFRPLRFPAHAAIRIASKPGELKRTTAVTLRDLPGSGSGWYRDAKLGLHHSGELNKITAGAAVILRAGRRDVLLDPSVPLQVRNRRNGKYEAVEPLPHAAMPNTIYRAGAVYFQVEV